MANHPSAEKRHRQSVKRAARNQAVRSHVRTEVKKLRTLVGQSDAANAREALPKVASTLDKAASKGVLHKNAAARRISRLAKQVAKLG
ncbi:30S ribosomal protein S20 [Candidatus Binatia bacterium]|jgi:small subunit ribosomal protein S20|nr:30S ribosomal protein S20 [Candidatus Binatia bacterium]